MHKKILESGVRMGYTLNQDGIVSVKLFYVTEPEQNKLTDLDLYFTKAHYVEHVVAEFPREEYNKIADKILNFNALTTAYYTYYYIDCKKQDFNQVFEFLLNNTLNRTLDEQTIRREANIIDIESVVTKIEYAPSFHFLNPISPLTINQYERSVEEINQLSSIFDNQELRALKAKNTDRQALQDYYDKHYVPHKLLVSLENVTQENVNFATQTLENKFANFPKTKPFYYNNYQKFIKNIPNIPLPNVRFFVEPIKGDKSQVAYVNLFLPAYHFTHKNYLISALYNHLIGKQGLHSYNSKMQEFSRNKRGATYILKTTILGDSKQAFINSYYKTTSKHVRTLLSSHKNMMVKIANNQIFNKKMFDKIKQDYIKVHKNTTLENTKTYSVSYMFKFMHDENVPSLEQFEKRVMAVSYHDFMNYAKFLATTNDFFISCTGNGISYRDLEAFELKQKPKLQLQRHPDYETTKAKLKAMVNTQDFEM